VSARLDGLHAELALRAPPPLREFNRAGLLSAADVHVATELARLGGAGAGGGDVLLAAALAVRAPRLGHVFVDLATVADTAAIESDEDADLSALPWPEPRGWADRVAAARELVARGEDGDPGVRPLRLLGSRLYLDRFWREERQVAADLVAFGTSPLRAVDVELLRAGLARLLDDPRQRIAAACAVLRALAVVAGGPGTGKTTTVARIVALLAEQAGAAGRPLPLVALAAPTGKAAVRLEEAVHGEAATLAVEERVRASLLALRAATIHRLLGSRPGSRSRFVHDRANRLPHDVVVIDETSMVPLSLMARLLEAVRPDARLVLVGDPEQLTAIEAGAVLRDIVGPAARAPRMRPATRAVVSRAVGHEVAAEPPPVPEVFGDGIVVLDRVHRFGAEIAALAGAIRRGDAGAAIAALRDGGERVRWLEPAGDAAAEAIEVAAVAAGGRMLEAARAGRIAEALAALGSFRLLCAHRRGPHGVSGWSAQVERWLARALPDFDPGAGEYAGRPLLITANDYELRLANGDCGVIVQTAPGRLGAAFERDGELVTLAPSRLVAVETVYAMTIHKSQGSQFDVAAVVLPDASSRILTRELLYTAVTRARQALILLGDEATIAAAVQRPVARATGLCERLWGEGAA
jgi:exodeoxyribonuclease V alpha subunit